MITAIAIDDEPFALQIIAAYAKDAPYLQLRETFSSPSEAKLYLAENPCDLVFLDIHMPDISGIEFLKTIKKQVMVIFTTAFSKYAVTGFELNAIDYLLKPIEPKRFMQAIEKAKYYKNAMLPKNNQEYIYVHEEYVLLKIKIDDITHIESMDDYALIYLADGRQIKTLQTLKNLFAKLPSNRFIRVHRSFIVSLQWVKARKNKNMLIHNTQVPIGRSYTKSINQLLKP